MTYSENSMTLPAITRRNLLCAPAVFAMPAGIPFASPAAASSLDGAATRPDPALQLFADWQAAAME